MDLRYLRYFIAVAEERSFTRAADRLNTVQPSLSQQIKKLEDEFVGTPLFHRDKHHVELTEAGRVFLIEARAILRSVDSAIALAQQTARGEIGYLSIGFVPGADAHVFPHVLPVLRTRCPGIHLNLRSLTTPEQIEALREHTIDLGFMRSPVEDRSLVSEVVLQEEIVAVVPARHAIARRKRIPVAELAQLPFVQVARSGAPAVHDIANRIAALAGVSFETALTTEGVLGTLNAVGSGLGFSLAPDYVRRICPETVAVRPLEIEPPPRIDLVVTHRDGDELPALLVFLDLLHAWMRTG